MRVPQRPQPECGRGQIGVGEARVAADARHAGSPGRRKLAVMPRAPAAPPDVAGCRQRGVADDRRPSRKNSVTASRPWPPRPGPSATPVGHVAPVLQRDQVCAGRQRLVGNEENVSGQGDSTMNQVDLRAPARRPSSRQVASGLARPALPRPRGVTGLGGCREVDEQAAARHPVQPCRERLEAGPALVYQRHPGKGDAEGGSLRAGWTPPGAGRSRAGPIGGTSAAYSWTWADA